MVDRPEEVESFVLLDDEESFEVLDEFENLDLRLFDGDGGGMWRGKGEPGQSITFTFPKLSLSLTLYQTLRARYQVWLGPSPKPKSQDHLVVSVGWLSLCRGLCAVKAKTGFKPTICCLGYSLKYPLFDIFTVFLFCVAILQVYIFTFFDWNINDSTQHLTQTNVHGQTVTKSFKSTRTGKQHCLICETEILNNSQNHDTLKASVVIDIFTFFSMFTKSHRNRFNPAERLCWMSQQHPASGTREQKRRIVVGGNSCVAPSSQSLSLLSGHVWNIFNHLKDECGRQQLCGAIIPKVSGNCLLLRHVRNIFNHLNLTAHRGAD